MNMTALLKLSFLILLFQNCSVWIPGGMIDSTTPVPQGKYKVLGEATGEETSTTFLIFQFNKPNKDFIERTTQKAIKSLNGDELINVTWYHKYTNYLLFHTYSFVVKGTVVKKAEVDATAYRNIQNPQNLPQASVLSTERNVINLKKLFQNLGLQVSFVLGGREYENIYDYYTGENSLTKFVGGYRSLAFNLFIQKPSRFIYFYPQISYLKLTKNRDEKIIQNGRILWIERSGNYIRSIPITLNVGFNFARLKEFPLQIPIGLNPYINFGVGYYITQNGNSPRYSDWEWKNFGYRFGIGMEYKIQPQISIIAGFNRNSVFSTIDYSFWGLGVGLVYDIGR